MCCEDAAHVGQIGLCRVPTALRVGTEAPGGPTHLQLVAPLAPMAIAAPPVLDSLLQGLDKMASIERTEFFDTGGDDRIPAATSLEDFRGAHRGSKMSVGLQPLVWRR